MVGKLVFVTGSCSILIATTFYTRVLSQNIQKNSITIIIVYTSEIGQFTFEQLKIINFIIDKVGSAMKSTNKQDKAHFWLDEILQIDIEMNWI